MFSLVQRITRFEKTIKQPRFVEFQNIDTPSVKQGPPSRFDCDIPRAGQEFPRGNELVQKFGGTHFSATNISIISDNEMKNTEGLFEMHRHPGFPIHSHVSLE